jgi:hypothetical protein
MIGFTTEITENTEREASHGWTRMCKQFHRASPLSFLLSHPCASVFIRGYFLAFSVISVVSVVNLFDIRSTLTPWHS